VHDGRSNWFEGIMLTAVYIIIAIAFFFVAD
jgi:Ca2+:H+ antiporter